MDRDAIVGVVGLGYVGLPLAVAFAERGFEVRGIDVSEDKVTMLAAGRSPIEDIDHARVAALVDSGRFRASTEYTLASECDVLFVCVPTPFDAYKTPDLSYVLAAADGIAQELGADSLVILQSTTYPGTTEEVIRPRLERGGLVAGRDFHLAFVPERIDPGVKDHTVLNTPKVVGGVTPECARLAALLLGTLGPEVHVVGSPRVAEMTKLLENIFRSVNIALVNELALLCERMEVDVWEVIRAASTKPFGYMPFFPGPGVGGHCIPVDPYYLSWKAREFDFSTRFIELAAEINQRMPHHVVDLVTQALNARGLALSKAAVLVIGAAFKPNVSDPRNSPAGRVIGLLRTRGADVSYHDALVPRFTVGGDVFHPERVTLESVEMSDERVSGADVVVLVVRHDALDVERIVANARLVVDTCDASRGLDAPNVVRLGAPRHHTSVHHSSVQTNPHLEEDQR